MEVNKNDPVPMTFAGGPTYMVPYLKDTLKKELFSCTSSSIKKNLSSTLTPTTSNFGKYSTEPEIISEVF